MKNKEYQLTDNHKAIVELYGVYVFMWIEAPAKWWVFNYHRRVSGVKLFELVNYPPPYSGRQMRCGIANGFMILQINLVNLYEFNLKSEIDTLYLEYKKSLIGAENRAKQIDNIFNI